MTPNEEDLLLRNYLESSAVQFTPEELEKIYQEAPWIKVTDERSGNYRIAEGED
jgi:hypothetical protein